MFVYLAPLQDSLSFKIGRSCRPDTRLATLAESHEFDLDWCWLIDCREDRAAIRLEAFLHEVASSYARPLPTPGGTEFFDGAVFDAVVKATRGIAEIAGYTVRHFQADLVEDESAEDRLARRVSTTIRNRRLNMRVRQEDLAASTGVSIGTLKRLERGEHVSTRALYKVCVALSLEELLPAISLEDAPVRQRATARQSLGAQRLTCEPLSLHPRET